jgi:hypothetical protein
MKPLFAPTFLIVAAASVLHVSFWTTVLVLFGYYAFGSLDEWIGRRARNNAFEAEIEWEPDPENPEMENRGGLTRRRLIGKDQVIVTRLTESIWRIR